MDEIQIVSGIIATLVVGVWVLFRFKNRTKHLKVDILSEKRTEAFHSAGETFLKKYHLYTLQINRLENENEDWLQVMIDFYANETKPLFSRFKSMFPNNLDEEFQKIEKFYFPSSITSNEEYRKNKPALDKVFQFSNLLNSFLEKTV